MKKIFSKYTVTSYYILALLVSLLLLIPHIIFGAILTPSFALTQFGPTLALILFAVILNNKDVFINSIKRFKFKKIVVWMLIIFILNFAIVFFVNIILNSFGKDFSPWTGNTEFYVKEIVALLICAAGEEIGWRGFLLPELNKKHTLLKSSIILGILWGVWHLNFQNGILGFILYTLSLTFDCVFISWLYVKTKYNLTLIVFYHFCFNLFSHLFLWNRFSIKLYIVECIVYGILALSVVIYDKKLFLKSQVNI